MYLTHGTVSRVMPNLYPDDKDEALQEAAIGLLLSVERFDPQYGTKFYTFAISTIRGSLLEWARREDWVPRLERQKERRGEAAIILHKVSLSEEWDLAEAIPDDRKDPEMIALERAEYEALDEYLEQLHHHDRLVMEALFFGGLTLAEVGEALDRCESAIHVTKKRGLKRLRELMEGEREEEAGR